MKLFQAVVAIALAASLVVVSGCSSSPAESVSETPKMTASQSASTQQSEQELFKAATIVAQGINEETTRLGYAGGAEKLPPSMLEYVTGDLATDFTAIYRNWKEAGDVSLGPDPRLVWVRRHDKTREESVISVAVCTDATKSRVRHSDQSITTGAVAINYYYLKYFDGKLKAFQSGHDWVDQC